MNSPSRLVLAILLSLLILCALAFYFTQKKSSSSPDRFWAHRFQVKVEVSYDARDDRQRLDLFLQGEWSGEPDYFKITGTPKATVIQVHGGGWISGDKTDVANWLIPYVERAWHGVNVNYRIGPNSAPDAVDDVLCALKWVAENAKTYRIDPDRIVLTGFSSGGHLALIAGLMNQQKKSHRCYTGDQLKIRAIVNWFGITDIQRLVSYLDANNRPNFPLRWIGERSKLPFFSKILSPINYVTGTSPPILTIHGDGDSVVPYDQAAYLHRALDQYGVKNRLVTLKGGTHGGFTDSQYQEAFSTIFKFLGDLGIN